MKTTTYLRLSLLIPFVVWGVCLALFAVTNVSPTTGGLVGRSIGILFLFYVFGIIGWLIPYLLLCLILLILSLKNGAETLIKIFALSPLAMALFVVAFVIIILGGSPDPSSLSPDLATPAGEFFGSSAWFAIITLVWGYICVAIGYGIYRLLQALHVIRDTPAPVAPNVTEAA